MSVPRAAWVVLFVVLSSGTRNDLASSASTGRVGDLYQVGVGISDATGPSAEIGLMGYASLSQIANGIHMRLFSRAFIFQSGESRAVFVSIDAAMIDTAVKREVVRRLESKYRGLYTTKNVLLSGTHTHSGPGGYIQYAMYGITSLGFHTGNFNAIVDGIVQSIERAHDSLQPGRLYLTEGRLEQANINRSPLAYEANPEAERNQYRDNVDKDMVLLRVESADGVPLGAINWFAVHPTSMNNTNKLVSGDNKGYASQLLEAEMNPGYRPGRGKFVGAFASTNLGDVSPNIMGPKCVAGPDIGKSCDNIGSTCSSATLPGNFVQSCIAFGPGRFGDMYESTEIIGRRQFNKARELLQSAAGAENAGIVGPVQFNHQYVNMTNVEVQFLDPVSGRVQTRSTCPAAMGYSFAAGTTDGPGMFDFKQGATSGNAFWDTISSLLKAPTPDQIHCHAPKPILLNTGPIVNPYAWTPAIVETQLLRIGNLYLAGIPGELTTMAGRRLRNAVRDRILETDPAQTNARVVVAGLSNVYTHYVTTWEEYQVQRYEGASTIYGPHTLQAYTDNYAALAQNMIQGVSTPEGPTPPDYMDKQISLLAPIVADRATFGFSFGMVTMEPAQEYRIGQTVTAKFSSGHPRNNPLRGGSFLLVERRLDDGSGWEVVATDADWSTKFTWRRLALASFESEVEIKWTPDDSTALGVYRIRHFGYFKPALQEPRPYQGATRTFEVRRTSLKRREGEKKKAHSPLLNFWKRLTTRTLSLNN